MAAIAVASITPQRRYDTSLSLQLSPNPAWADNQITVSGQLTAASQPLPDRSVQAAYSSDNQTWVDLSSTVTDSRGAFSLHLMPKGQGSLYVRALFADSLEYRQSGLVSTVSTFASPSDMVGIHMILWDDSDTRYKGTYFDLLKSYGINSIMLDFGWNKLEPTKGVYDQNYLGKMDRFIQKAKARGIYVTLRMHKWGYPGAYQAQQPNNAWLLGYPAWLNNTPDFWENVGNCWDNYVAMWTMLATHYKNEVYVAGFDLFGEPGNDIGPGIYDPQGVEPLTWHSNTCRKVMGVLFDKDRLYERTINAIHSIAIKPVIIESFDGDTLKYVKNVTDSTWSLPQRPRSEGFAVSQSVYDWFQFEWLDDQKAGTDSWNVPLLASEFGVQVNVIKTPSPANISWVQQACQAFAARNMGWFYWYFGPGPSKNDWNLIDQADGSVSPILSNTLQSAAKASVNKKSTTNMPTLVASGIHLEMPKELSVSEDTLLLPCSLQTSVEKRSLGAR